MMRLASRRRGVLALVALVVAAATVPVVAPVTPAAAATTYTFGQQPFSDVLYWAGRSAACGLSQNQLAALMLAPTYPETGAYGPYAPSPMTLSRYDTQAALYAFGDSATPYQRAFWHPGVGAWAFDSAGGWNLTAATAISTDTSAAQAAATMAQRWCNYSGDPANQAARRAYVWAPWYGCGANKCETIYNAIYDPAGLRVTLDPAVSRYGGMVNRLCAVQGIGQVACAYVNPAAAQGYKGFASPTFGPSPLSSPFYVFEYAGREYRWWLRQDSGYGVTVSGSKLVTANARTVSPTRAISWATGDGLCDLSAGRGTCDWTGSTPSGALTTVTPAVATNTDGRLEIFAAGPDGAVWHTWQIVANGDWSPWFSLGRPAAAIREIGAGRNPDGRLEVFLLLADGTISHAWITPTSGWSPWVGMGGNLARELLVGTNADGRLELFGLDASGVAVHRWLQPVGGWTGWLSLGGPPLWSASLARNRDGRLELFGLDAVGRLTRTWQVVRNGGWSGWLGEGGGYVGRPAVATNTDGRLEVFVRDAGGTLLHRWQLAPNAGWSPMLGMGGSLVGDPLVATNPDGRLEVFAKGVDGRLSHSWQAPTPSGWSGWLGFDGMSPASLVVAANANRRILLVARAADGTLYRNLQLVG